MKDKIIVITGAARGLGKVLSEMLTAKGAVVVGASREIEAPGIQTDVANEVQVEALAAEAVRRHGKIDTWINNAGIWMPRSLVEEVDVEKTQKLFQVNFFGTLFGMRSAIRHMKKQGYGTIVNVSSTTAFDGMNGSSGSMYVASKYAIRGLTNCVREEVKDSGISVIGVYPGGFKSDLFNEAKPDNFDNFMTVESVAEKMIANLEQEVPETQLVLKRPGQNDPKADETKIS